MISTEILRRYPFFAGLSVEQISTLAKMGSEEIVEEGHYFFHEEQELVNFYLTLEGAIGIVYDVPERNVEHKIADQFARKLDTKEIVISTVGPGHTFGWSGLIPPHKATASSKALTSCRVIAFNGKKLLKAFNDDHSFGFAMIQKIAQIIGGRLRDLRIETLTFKIE